MEYPFQAALGVITASDRKTTFEQMWYDLSFKMKEIGKFELVKKYTITITAKRWTYEKVTIQILDAIVTLEG